MTFIKLPQHNIEKTAKLLAKLSYLRGISDEDLQLLLEGAVEFSLEQGRSVFEQDQMADYWYLVISGRVDTLRYGMDGEERIIHHIGVGELLAPVVMFAPQRRYPVSARAATDTRLCKLRREQLHKLCTAYPLIALQLLELAAAALASRIDDVDSLAGHTAIQRIARYFICIMDQQHMTVKLPMTQRQLAAKLGVRAETFNRVLSEWQRRGYILGGRRAWKIISLQALQKTASEA